MAFAVYARLGWSNPDTGPANKRLYATDQGDSPRWAKPRARVVEDALEEHGCYEGTRVLVIALDRDLTQPELEQCAVACLESIEDILG
jgi:hypothetical protein